MAARAAKGRDYQAEALHHYDTGKRWLQLGEESTRASEHSIFAAKATAYFQAGQLLMSIASYDPPAPASPQRKRPAQAKA
jgi:hypothetical protein